MGLEGKWSREADQIIARDEAITKINGEAIPRRLVDRPNFEVFQLDLDRGDGEPPILIYGNAITIPMQVSIIMAVNRLLEQKDIGQWVGDTLDSHIRAINYSTSSSNSLRLKLVWWSEQSPPYNTRKHKQARYGISFINPAKLTWTKIKTAMGGKEGFLWGPHKISVPYQSGIQLSRLVVHGGSDPECKKLSDTLLGLTVGRLLKETMGKETINRSFQPDKKSIRLYPAYATLINGSEQKHSYRIPMWLDKEPPNVDKEIARVVAGDSN